MFISEINLFRFNKKIQKRPLPRIQISDSISDITGLVSAIELDLLDHSKNIYREDPGYGQLFGEFENKILLQSNPKNLRSILISLLRWKILYLNAKEKEKRWAKNWLDPENRNESHVQWIGLYWKAPNTSHLNLILIK